MGSIAEAVHLGANVLVIGVAPFGGALTPEWRAALLDAMLAGMHVEAGLHTVLSEDAELAEAAAAAGVELRDLRAAPPGLSVPPGPAKRPDVRVVHTVGSDCAIGKMSVTLELDAAARARGLESAFVATGQTGHRDLRLGDRGRPRDLGLHRRRRRAAGARRARSARRCCSSRARARSSTRPTRASRSGCCTAACPTRWCSATARERPFSRTTTRRAILPLPELVKLYEGAIGWIRPARVSALALNTRGLDDDAARAAIAAASEETGLPATDPVRFGGDALLDALTA